MFFLDCIKKITIHKKILIFAVVLILAIALVSIFSTNHSANLVGEWKINAHAMPDYGISLTIDKHTIDARGDMLTYGGRMTFKVSVKRNGA